MAIILILFSIDKQAMISFLDTQNPSSTPTWTPTDTSFHHMNYHEKFIVCYAMAYIYLVTYNDGGMENNSGLLRKMQS
jgi:hypothetical protein